MGHFLGGTLWQVELILCGHGGAGDETEPLLTDPFAYGARAKL